MRTAASATRLQLCATQTHEHLALDSTQTFQLVITSAYVERQKLQRGMWTTDDSSSTERHRWSALPGFHFMLPGAVPSVSLPVLSLSR